jgi:hypothetical protein
LFAEFVLYNGGFGTENVLSKINNLKMVNPGDSIKNSGPALINTHTHTQFTGLRPGLSWHPDPGSGCYSCC